MERAMEVAIEAGDTVLSGSLRLPAGDVRAGLIPLHGAEAGHRSFFLYEHLAQILPAAGIAVLRYDRRTPPGLRGDVPLDVQAADAHAAMEHLRAHVGELPIGLWGFSQGGWAAPLAAASAPAAVAFLVAVSSCGVSPAAQMRYGTAEQLRKHGHGEDDVRELIAVRSAVERYYRGQADRAATQRLVDRAAARPWFRYAHVRPHLPIVGPDSPAWPDMDFDPGPIFARVRCPVLAFYGETDEWTPIDESVAAWRRATAASGNADVTIVRLPGCDHAPVPRSRTEIGAISELYPRTMLDWIDEHLPISS